MPFSMNPIERFNDAMEALSNFQRLREDVGVAALAQAKEISSDEEMEAWLKKVRTAIVKEIEQSLTDLTE